MNSQHDQSKKPNFLFIMADQFRHDHIGLLNEHPVDTPHLDALAASGMLFTQCVTNAPICSPARIALATGLHCLHSGALENASFVSRNHKTYYERLRDDDYRVAGFGKFDLAKGLEDNGNGRRPANYRWGFTDPLEIEGKMHAGITDLPIHGPYTRMLAERGLLDAFRADYERRRTQGWAISCHDSVLPTDAFADTYIGQQAVSWLQTVEHDYPWHLFVSFVGPHDPFDPPSEYADQFRHQTMNKAIIDVDADKRPAYIQKRALSLTPELIEETRRQYCASIKAIDDQVGALIACLEKRGERDQTYIIFTSDHGEMLGDLSMYQKAVPYEASVRIPLICAGPHISAGSRSDALVELADLNPSICALAGLHEQDSIDAQSFVPVLLGEQKEHRSECLSMLQNFRLIRNRQFKYVEHLNIGAELFDLSKDPHELHNCIAENPEQAQAMRQRMQERIWAEAAAAY